jgi:hypothetical protein
MQPGREVEHKLAKVGVEGSNPFTRSKKFKDIRPLRRLRLPLGREPVFGEASGKHDNQFRGSVRADEP